MFQELFRNECENHQVKYNQVYNKEKYHFILETSENQLPYIKLLSISIVFFTVSVFLCQIRTCTHLAGVSTVSWAMEHFCLKLICQNHWSTFLTAVSDTSPVERTTLLLSHVS